MTRIMKITREVLNNLYWDKELSMGKIGELFGLARQNIHYYMIKFNITRRKPKFYHQGKTYEQHYGIERANAIKKQMSKSHKGKHVGEKNHMYGKKGKLNPFYGKTHSKKVKEIISKSNKQFYKTKRGEQLRKKKGQQMKKIMTKLNKNPSFQKKRFKGLCKRPTKPERRIINLIKKYNLPFKYVGDGQVTIEKCNPDFINYNGKKQIIEMFGDYWHKRKPNLRSFQTEKGRKAIFKKYGFKTLIIWEHELTGRYGNKSTEEEIVNKIRSLDE